MLHAVRYAFLEKMGKSKDLTFAQSGAHRHGQRLPDGDPIVGACDGNRPDISGLGCHRKVWCRRRWRSLGNDDV